MALDSRFRGNDAGEALMLVSPLGLAFLLCFEFGKARFCPHP